MGVHNAEMSGGSGSENIPRHGRGKIRAPVCQDRIEVSGYPTEAFYRVGDLHLALTERWRGSIAAGSNCSVKGTGTCPAL